MLVIKENHTYKVEPKMKKSVYEAETWKAENKRWVTVTECWRWGSFYITPRDEDEVANLQACVDTEEMICVSDFQEWEMEECWDGCSTDLEFYGEDWKDDAEKEAFEEGYFEESWDHMEKEGFDSHDTEFEIYNGVEITEQ